MGTPEVVLQIPTHVLPILRSNGQHELRHGGLGPTTTRHLNPHLVQVWTGYNLCKPKYNHLHPRTSHPSGEESTIRLDCPTTSTLPGAAATMPVMAVNNEDEPESNWRLHSQYSPKRGRMPSWLPLCPPKPGRATMSRRPAKDADRPVSVRRRVLIKDHEHPGCLRRSVELLHWRARRGRDAF